MNPLWATVVKTAVNLIFNEKELPRYSDCYSAAKQQGMDHDEIDKRAMKIFLRETALKKASQGRMTADEILSQGEIE